MSRRIIRIFGIILLFSAFSLHSDSPSFSYRPLTAGRALLTIGGFLVERSLGNAAFSPDFVYPLQLQYDTTQTDKAFPRSK